MSRRIAHPETWSAPPRGTVLVLAPHPDDESIGCGGVIALHARQGDSVHVVVATDGARGDPEGRFAPESYVELRRVECRAAAGVLGAAEPSFLGFPDGELRPDGALESALLEVLARHRPQTIYHPPCAEMHPDHGALGAALLAALASSRTDAEAYAYEIWVPVEPTHVIDVSSAWDDKKRAIECYRSQLAYNDYLRAAQGLNAYRSIFLPGAAYVEAYERTWSAASPVRRSAVTSGGRLERFVGRLRGDARR